MFKTASFEDEIMASMETKLVANQTESKFGFNKLAKATDFLSTAAEMLDKAGMTAEADELVTIIQELSKEIA